MASCTAAVVEAASCRSKGGGASAVEAPEAGITVVGRSNGGKTRLSQRQGCGSVNGRNDGGSGGAGDGAGTEAEVGEKRKVKASAVLPEREEGGGRGR